MPSRRKTAKPETSLTSASSGARLLDVGPTPPMTPKAVEYLRYRLAKPPDGRHDPRSIFGSALTMERIQSTLYQADWGSPRALTDLSREMLTMDPHLSAVLTKRIGQVGALPVEVLPAKGPGIDPARAAFYAEVVRAQFDRIPNLRMAVKQLAWALYDGRAVLEKKWAKAPGASHPKFGRATMAVVGLAWVHPRRIFYGPERELRVVDRPITIGFTRDGVDLRAHPHKFIEFTPQLFGEYPEREGLDRPCLYWCFFKRFSARERMILTELFAKPWRWGEIGSDEDISPQDRADLDTIVEQIAGNGFAVLPRGAELKIQSPGQIGAGGTIHKEVIDQADDQISKLVLGQTGTTDSKAQGLGGSQSDVMKGEQDLIKLGDAALLEECIEDFLADDIIEVNFGPAAVTHAPRIKLHADTVDRIKELGRVKAGLDAGLEIAVDEAYEVSGFRKPDPDEAVLKIDSPAGGGSSGGIAPDGTPIPATPGQARAIIAYPPDEVPPARVQVKPPAEATAPTAPTGLLPGDESAPAPELPAHQSEDPIGPQAPEQTDPSRATDARGNDPAYEDPMRPTGGAPIDISGGPVPDAPRPGIMTAGDSFESETDAVEPGIREREDPENYDKDRPRGIFERELSRDLRTLISDAPHVQNEPLPAPAPVHDDSVADGTPVPNDLKPTALVPPDELELPMGPYKDFADCVSKQKAKGESDESAHKICGKIKSKIEGAVTRAARESGGMINETGARRIIHCIGEKEASRLFLVMRTRRLSHAEEISCCGGEVALTKQPKTVYGSVEPIVTKSTKELALVAREWAGKLMEAGHGAKSPYELFGAVYKAGQKLKHDEFARALARRVLHSEMLGVLDNHFERATDETIAPAKFDRRAWPREITLLAAENVAKVSPTFSDLSYKPATEFFQKKAVIPKDAFEKLEDGAKARAFTVARMESQELLNLVHAEIGRMIGEGTDLKDFKKFMKERVESAGWTPANPSHVQTIARTNLVQAQTVGRLVDSTQPAVLVDRPYWQIRGVKDSRQRATHGAVDGSVLRADSPFFQKAMPGAFGYNDRCRHVTLSAKQVEKRGLTAKTGSEPEFQDLPDKGFSGGGAGALLAAFGAK